MNTFNFNHYFSPPSPSYGFASSQPQYNSHILHHPVNQSTMSPSSPLINHRDHHRIKSLHPSRENHQHHLHHNLHLPGNNKSPSSTPYQHHRLSYSPSPVTREPSPHPRHRTGSHPGTSTLPSLYGPVMHHTPPQSRHKPPPSPVSGTISSSYSHSHHPRNLEGFPSSTNHHERYRYQGGSCTRMNALPSETGSSTTPEALTYRRRSESRAVGLSSYRWLQRNPSSQVTRYPYSTSSPSSYIISGERSSVAQSVSDMREVSAYYEVTGDDLVDWAQDSSTQSATSEFISSFTLPKKPDDNQNLEDDDPAEYSDEEDDKENTSERVKEKLLSLWNNMKYGWRSKIPSYFNPDLPIWLLGHLYHHNQVDLPPSGKGPHRGQGNRMFRSEKDRAEDIVRQKELAAQLFREDFHSRIWFTYRKGFLPLCPPTKGVRDPWRMSMMTTDCGWGCMLRSGQMLLAQSLVAHLLDKGWRWSGKTSDKSDMIHRMVIKWFLDSSENPFSLHQLVRIGSALGKKPGDWYGPATAAHVLNQALCESYLENPLLENFVSYVAQDCTVYIEDVIQLCTQSDTDRRKSSVIQKEVRQRAFSLAANTPSNEIDRILSQAKEGRDSEEEHSPSPSSTFTGSAPSTTPSPCDHEGDRTTRHLPHSRSLLNHKAASTFNLSYDSTGTSGYGSNQQTLNNRLSKKTPSPLNRCGSTLNEVPSGGEKKEEKVDTTTPNKEPQTNEPSTDSQDGTNSKWRGVLILIPVRLGGETFNPVYSECVKSFFAHPSCLGIIGGKPKKSFYFVGTQDDKLIYLDPHLCQDTVDATQSDFPLRSFHCDSPRKLPIIKMDPSCTIAFYCRSREEFMELVGSVKDFMVPGQRHTDYPIFVFAPGSSQETRTEQAIAHTESILKVKHRFYNQKSDTEYTTMGEDFVLIS